MKYFYIITMLLLGFVMSKPSFSQEENKKDSVQENKKAKSFKNTVRVNITNPLIFGGNAYIFGYERTIGEHQSICIDVGRMSLPKLLPGSFDVNGIKIESTTAEKGYHVSLEYRFYLKNENRHNAPRGVYLSPYFSYNYFNRKNTWNLNTNAFQGDLTTEFTFTMRTFGAELGYQFILWKRLAIDLVLLGPGMTTYNIETELSTTLEADDQALLFQKINDVLSDKIPGYSLVIDDAEFERSGRVNTTSVGFRYMIYLGFRF